jgi:multidrug efflux system outer membrane protein
MMVAMVLAGALVAQDTARLTLTAVVDRALAGHPSVAAARAAVDRAEAEVDEAQAARRPRLALDMSLNQFQEPMVVQPLHGFDPRNPPHFDRTLLQSGLQLSWTVLDFGVRSARVRVQESLGEAAESALSTTTQQLVARVVNAYLRVVTARELLTAQDQRLAALAGVADRTRQLLATGKAARVDVLRVDAEMRRAEADRIGSRSQLSSAERELAQLAQVSWEAVHGAALAGPRLAAAAAIDTTAGGRARLVQTASEANPLVREGQQRVQAAQAAHAAARATWFPELRLAGGFIDRGRWARDFQGEWQVGVALSYPIYTGGSRASVIRKLAAEEHVATEQLRAGRLDVERAVDQALAALEESQARVVALVSAVQQSEEVARIERLALDVGQGTQTDYLQAEASLLSARAGLIQARLAEVSARVELARIAGELGRDWLARNVESAS